MSVIDVHLASHLLVFILQTSWTQYVNWTSWMSSERLMHVQFTSCAQGENLLRKTSNSFLLELLSEKKGNLTWYDMLIFLYYGENKYCVKSVCIWSFYGPYFPTSPYLFVFSPNSGKYRQEKLRIRTLFTQWNFEIISEYCLGSRRSENN